MKITDLTDGGCIVEFEGEIIHYTEAEIEEMKRDYIKSIEVNLSKLPSDLLYRVAESVKINKKPKPTKEKGA